MGYVSIILASILCAGAPLPFLAAQSISQEQTVSKEKLGKEKVADVRKAYANGDYRQFLRQMDESYKNADLSGLIEMRQKAIPADFQLQWEERFSKLQKERNDQLLKTLPEHENSLFADMVRSMASSVETDAQAKAVSKLNSFVAAAPNSGVNADENALIAIDLEYEYKMLHAKMPSEDISPEQMGEYLLVLRMEKMEKMVEASKSFQDHTLKQAVGLAASNLDARLARNLDGFALNAMAKSELPAQNETEEQALSIITLYQGKFSELMKDLDQANQ